MADDLLTASGLVVGYGRGGAVLHGVDVRIGRGETVGIVGESGSGKTTLGRALLRLVDAAAGRLCFDGADITRLPERRMRKLRRRMQMIFQDPMASLNPRHRIRRILVQPLLLHGFDRPEQRIASIFERFSLPLSCLERHPHELSGGQRQRVGIARAALLEPDFVLADEIVSGLDVSTQAQVLGLLGELSRDLGLAMALISHDLAVVRAVCDRVYVLRRGRVVEHGTCAQVFTDPQADYTRALLDAIPPARIDPGWLTRERTLADG